MSRRNADFYPPHHYNAGSTLAADWKTELTAPEVAASSADLLNATVIGAGCHVGDCTVDEDAVAQVTLEPDWAQAFAIQRVGAFIGGTGDQYGDTEFIEYNERLYVEFARQLRSGTPATTVAVGKALVAAKRKYLSETPVPVDPRSRRP